MAPWWWFPCKPKHDGTFLLILKCFNNSTFYNVVCISWKLKCWILLMHGVTMKFMEHESLLPCWQKSTFNITLIWKLPYCIQNSYSPTSWMLPAQFAIALWTDNPNSIWWKVRNNKVIIFYSLCQSPFSAHCPILVGSRWRSWLRHCATSRKVAGPIGLGLLFFIDLTLRLLISYIYGAPSKVRNANVVYIWTYVWQRWKSFFLFAAQCFNTESMQRGFLCHICV